MGKVVVLVVVVLVLAGGIYYLTADRPDVVIYASLDQPHSEPILREFEKETGLNVRMVFDSELNKTVGRTNALLEEKSNPKADVYWNNEVMNTVRLKEADVLQPYESPSARDIPAKWKDPEHYWTGFAARARVIILNTEIAKEIEPDETKWPKSTEDFLDPKWKGRIAIAKPITGTTLTHMTVFWSMKGPEFTLDFWRRFSDNEGFLPPSNSAVMKLVREGRYAFGFTDTDDFQVAADEGFPVRRIFPDQDEGGMVTGCLVIPNSVALVKNCPHPENGKRLIDYILSRQVEEKLARGSSAQMPVRGSVPRPDYVKSAEDLVTMDVDWAKAADASKPFQDWFQEFLAK